MTHQTTPQFRLDHVMVRVKNLDSALGFYRDILGMKVIRQAEYAGGRFTNTFLAFDGQEEQTALELTWNWDRDSPYESGNAWGHLALVVPDLIEAMNYLATKNVRIRTPPPQDGARKPDDRLRLRPG
ncbi:VOC family protein [Primorskyibacter flagellatus]|uniref:VOC family protein n=1 Tax=Primorskyibacter flagellatus TaxID=1387277 RepID=UPI003A91AAC9